MGFSNGWAEFMPKKPPPLVPSILIGLEGCDRADDDGLLFRLALVVVPHGARLQGRDLVRALKVIGLPCDMKIRPKTRATGTNM